MTFKTRDCGAVREKTFPIFFFTTVSGFKHHDSLSTTHLHNHCSFIYLTEACHFSFTYGPTHGFDDANNSTPPSLQCAGQPGKTLGRAGGRCNFLRYMPQEALCESGTVRTSINVRASRECQEDNQVLLTRRKQED